MVLGLADQRVLRLQELMPDRDGLRGDAAEHATHGHRMLPGLSGGEFARSGASRSMAIKEREPSRIWWARPGKLCGMERPGGGGRSHRPERRSAEIAYLKE